MSVLATNINGYINNKKSNKKKFLFVLASVILSIIYIFPIYILILNSFKTQKGLFENVLGLPNKETFTLNNYKEAFSKLNFFHSFFNSLFITVISVILILLVSSMAAWVLVRYKTKISKALFILFTVSMIIPFQCTMLPLLMVSKNVGLLNPIGLIFMYVGFGVGMSIFIMHGFIKNVPEELEEAAVIDGCNVFQLFFVVVMPLLKVILISVAVINVMWIWNDFLLPSIVLLKPEWKTLPLMTYSFFGAYSKEWDLKAAALFMCILPIIVFYLWSQKYVISGITEGSIK